jgi:hypothetical protein
MPLCQGKLTGGFCCPGKVIFMELLKIILTSGIVSSLTTLILALLQRWWSKKDKKEEKTDKKNQDTDSEIRALVIAQKCMMIDRAKALGKSYLQAGEITLDEKDRLREMYKAYEGLGGNGHLDSVMEEIEKLRVVGEKDGGDGKNE